MAADMKALRKPFPKEQIGRLPKTAKRPALDFVGHAAVTDRLNQAAPGWSYTVDEMFTMGSVCWIRGTLTIDGVSRTEYGDGDDPKEAIGNFLRRAAMRWGVAIDLWSRDADLTTSAGAGPNETAPVRGEGAGETPAAPADQTSDGGNLGAVPLGEEGAEQAPPSDVLHNQDEEILVMVRNFFDLCADLGLKPLPTFVKATESSVRYNDLKKGEVDAGDIHEALAYVTTLKLKKGE